MTTDDRIKRLKFRSWHRGTREMDLLLGSFADAHLDGFTANELDQYETIMEQSDPDLYNWIIGKECIPAEFENNVMHRLRKHRFTDKSSSA